MKLEISVDRRHLTSKPLLESFQEAGHRGVKFLVYAEQQEVSNAITVLLFPAFISHETEIDRHVERKAPTNVTFISAGTIDKNKTGKITAKYGSTAHKEKLKAAQPGDEHEADALLNNILGLLFDEMEIINAKKLLNG